MLNATTDWGERKRRIEYLKKFTRKEWQKIIKRSYGHCGQLYTGFSPGYRILAIFLPVVSKQHLQVFIYDGEKNYKLSLDNVLEISQ